MSAFLQDNKTWELLLEMFGIGSFALVCLVWRLLKPVKCSSYKTHTRRCWDLESLKELCLDRWFSSSMMRALVYQLNNARCQNNVMFSMIAFIFHVFTLSFRYFIHRFTIVKCLVKICLTANHSAVTQFARHFSCSCVTLLGLKKGLLLFTEFNWPKTDSFQNPALLICVNLLIRRFVIFLK